MQCQTSTTGNLVYIEGAYSIRVPARSDPIPGVQRTPLLLVAPTCYDIVVAAAARSPLTVPLALADMSGIRWRTGPTNGGNLCSTSVPTSPAQMLASLFTAAKQINEPPLAEAAAELALLWPESSSALQIDTDSFHIFREQFRRALAGAALPPDCTTTIYCSGDNPWGTPRFTVENSELCRKTVDEAIQYLTTLTGRTSGAAVTYHDRWLRDSLAKSQSPVLALAVLHLRRDLGVAFAPMTSPLGFVEEQLGSVPPTVQTHTEQFEFWPKMGEQGLLRHCTGMQFRTASAPLQLSECSDPSGLAKRRIRGVVTLDRDPTERTVEVRFEFWASVPDDATGDLAVFFVNDKADRMQEKRYQAATMTESAAERAVQRAHGHSTLPAAAVAQLVAIEQRCDEMLVDAELPLQGEADLQRCMAAHIEANKTFLSILAPVDSEHALIKHLASAKGAFMQRFMQLQQRLRRYPEQPGHAEAAMPPPLYPGARNKRSRLGTDEPMRMASVGFPGLGGVSAAPLLRS